MAKISWRADFTVFHSCSIRKCSWRTRLFSYVTITFCKVTFLCWCWDFRFLWTIMTRRTRGSLRWHCSYWTIRPFNAILSSSWVSIINDRSINSCQTISSSLTIHRSIRGIKVCILNSWGCYINNTIWACRTKQRRSNLSRNATNISRITLNWSNSSCFRTVSSYFTLITSLLWLISLKCSRDTCNRLF